MGKTGRRVYEKDWREEKKKGKCYILIKTYLDKKLNIELSQEIQGNLSVVLSNSTGQLVKFGKF